VLLDLCNRIEEAKSASPDSDQTPYSMVQRLVSEVMGDHAWISKDKINNGKSASLTEPLTAWSKDLSVKSWEIMGDHAWISKDKISNGLRAQAAAKTHLPAASSFAHCLPPTIDIQQQSSTSTLMMEPSWKHGGWPKGSTNKNKRITVEKENNLANKISVIWDQPVTEAHENRIRNMPNGSLLNLINERKEYNSMNHINIHPDTI